LSDSYIHASTESGGEFQLGYDRTPPVIKILNTDSGIITFSATDYGSGLDNNSVKAVCGGTPLKCVYNAEIGDFSIELPELYMEKNISVEVKISD
jgi:hypothetical protein